MEDKTYTTLCGRERGDVDDLIFPVSAKPIPSNR